MFSSNKEEGGFFGSSKEEGGFFGTQKSTGSGITAAAASVLPSFSDEPACAACCPKLSYKQRLYGFIGCACLGYLLSVIGTMVLIGGGIAELDPFIGLYITGNVSLTEIC